MNACDTLLLFAIIAATAALVITAMITIDFVLFLRSRRDYKSAYPERDA